MRPHRRGCCSILNVRQSGARGAAETPRTTGRVDRTALGDARTGGRREPSVCAPTIAKSAAVPRPTQSKRSTDVRAEHGAQVPLVWLLGCGCVSRAADVASLAATSLTLAHLAVVQRPGNVAALDTTMREFTSTHRADVTTLQQRPAGCVAFIEAPMLNDFVDRHPNAPTARRERGAIAPVGGLDLY